MKLTWDWTNLSLQFATEFAPDAHVWRSVGARLHLGQLYKSLLDKHKPFIHKLLQTGSTDQISVTPCAASAGNRPAKCVKESDSSMMEGRSSR